MDRISVHLNLAVLCTIINGRVIIKIITKSERAND